MTRLMSVAFTEDAVRDRTKTVTRRKGWTFLRVGDRVTLCRKVMGRKPGEPLVRIVDVQIVSVRRERLGAITAEEVCKEGFLGMSPAEFMRRFFTDAQGIGPSDEVTRIEWTYIEEAQPTLEPERGDGKARGVTKAYAAAHPDCTEHPVERAKSIRQAHPADRCPASTHTEETDR